MNVRALPPLVVAYLIFLAIVAGCSAKYPKYAEPRLPDNQVARIRNSSPPAPPVGFDKEFYITKIDGKSLGDDVGGGPGEQIKIEPGEHTLETKIIQWAGFAGLVSTTFVVTFQAEEGEVYLTTYEQEEEQTVVLVKNAGTGQVVGRSYTEPKLGEIPWRARITSIPPGANVYLPEDGKPRKLLGKTPLEVDIWTQSIAGEPGKLGTIVITHHLPVLRTKDGFYCWFLIKQGDTEITRYAVWAQSSIDDLPAGLAYDLQQGKGIWMTGRFKFQQMIPASFVEQFPSPHISEIVIYFSAEQ